jgi:hypothetical protein
MIDALFRLKLNPWYLNGFLLLISKVPFIPPEPYNAEDAPDNSSIFSTSGSVRPTILPTEKFKPAPGYPYHLSID